MNQDRPATASSSSPESRSQEWVSVQGGPETTSAGTLLVIAYAAMWLLLMAFIALTFRRQTQVNDRLTALEKSLPKRPPDA